MKILSFLFIQKLLPGGLLIYRLKEQQGRYKMNWFSMLAIFLSTLDES